MRSNYSAAESAWNDGVGTERECKRCRGLGTDRDGADCVDCEGWGSVIVR